ncbi:MAG: polysaccharide pyruvyl transferase family protein [Planctomycetaceae bacterium]|nr:polysaccharide pyruvyl transferase family protein [Planctomycetaceae bacterium]MCB9952174.1 polysaccharide pyruvyl transferase family protein [Planctomycetaceae bacterium]
MIRLHWWNEARNFGDELSRLVVQHLSRRWVDWAPVESSHMTAIGSLLATHLHSQEMWDNYRGVVWGSGAMFAGDQIRLPLARVCAVRGQSTLEQVASGMSIPTAVGDPGLFAHELISSHPQNKSLLGIVPHWSDREHPFFRSAVAQHPDVRLIDPCNDPLTVIQQIAGCQQVLSSSLHGLVVADSLGIQNRWMRFDSGHEEIAGSSLFKFHDYFTLWDDEPQTPFSPQPQLRFVEYLNLGQQRDSNRVTAICRDLRQMFPFGPL